MKKPIQKQDLDLNSMDRTAFCLHIVNEVQQLMDPTFLENIDQDRITRFFFVNKSWRLTNNGFSILETMYATYTSVNESNKLLTGRILLRMDECIQGPWFIRGNKIIVFDQSIHFELGMVSGHLGSFTNFKSSRE